MSTVCLVAGDPKLAEKYHKKKSEVQNLKESKQTLKNREKLATPTTGRSPARIFTQSDQRERRGQRFWD